LAREKETKKKKPKKKEVLLGLFQSDHFITNDIREKKEIKKKERSESKTKKGQRRTISHVDAGKETRLRNPAFTCGSMVRRVGWIGWVEWSTQKQVVEEEEMKEAEEEVEEEVEEEEEEETKEVEEEEEQQEEKEHGEKVSKQDV
jgi:hypothetical protein